MDKVLLESFENICEWLETEGDCDLHTLKELQQKMKDFNGKGSYSSVYLKKNLKERYNDHVYFSDYLVMLTLFVSKKWLIILSNRRKRNKTKQKLTL